MIALQLALQLVLPTSALPTSAVLAAAGGPAWPTLAIEILGSGGVRTCRSAGHTADSGRCVRLPRASADAGRFSLMIILALFVGLGPLARYARARMPTAASQLVLCFKRQDPPPALSHWTSHCPPSIASGRPLLRMAKSKIYSAAGIFLKTMSGFFGVEFRILNADLDTTSLVVSTK